MVFLTLIVRVLYKKIKRRKVLSNMRITRIKSTLSNVILYFSYSLYILLASFIILEAFLKKGDGYSLYTTFIATCFGILIVIILMSPLKGLLSRITKTQYNLYILITICILVKISFVWFNRITPNVDYATFFYTAEKLSKYYVIPDSRYVALFPHIFGYSSFLSVFLRLFGIHYFLPPLINVVLSTLSMMLIYYICTNLISNFGACMASIIWILFPSQTVYNIFALSEPLYVTELLAFFALIVFINKKVDKYKSKEIVFWGIVFSALLCLINMARPIALIPAFAYIIWVLLVYTPNILADGLKKYVLLLLIMVTLYFIFLMIGNWYILQRLGEKPATLPGYNIYVGFNVASNGGWNQHDSNLLFYYNDNFNWSAVQVQSKMFEEAKNRILHGHIDLISLFYNKFVRLWGKDDACIAYASNILTHRFFLSTVCNAYYYVVVIFSIIGSIFALKDKDKSELFIVCVFIVGLTIAQMAVEVSSRYHYSGLITLTIVGAYGLDQLSRYKIRIQKDCLCA